MLMKSMLRLSPVCLETSSCEALAPGAMGPLNPGDRLPRDAGSHPGQDDWAASVKHLFGSAHHHWLSGSAIFTIPQFSPVSIG